MNKSIIIALIIVISVILGLFYNLVQEPNEVIVTSKAYTASPDFPKLPDCICYYNTSTSWKFQDSCNKYSVGDIIKIKKP